MTDWKQAAITAAANEAKAREELRQLRFSYWALVIFVALYVLSEVLK